jgi:hypothetical protein
VDQNQSSNGEPGGIAHERFEERHDHVIVLRVAVFWIFTVCTVKVNRFDTVLMQGDCWTDSLDSRFESDLRQEQK